MAIRTTVFDSSTDLNDSDRSRSSSSTKAGFFAQRVTVSRCTPAASSAIPCVCLGRGRQPPDAGGRQNRYTRAPLGCADLYLRFRQPLTDSCTAGEHPVASSYSRTARTSEESGKPLLSGNVMIHTVETAALTEEPRPSSELRHRPVTQVSETSAYPAGSTPCADHGGPGSPRRKGLVRPAM